MSNQPNDQPAPGAASNAALIGWQATMAGHLPPLRPGLRLRGLAWADLARLLRAHRQVMLVLLLSGVAIGAIGAATRPARIDADTLLMLGDADANGPAQAPDAGALADRLQSDIALLHSDAVANRLVQQIGVATLFPDLVGPHLFGLRLFGLGQAYSPAEQVRLAASRAASSIGAAAVPGAAMLRVSVAGPDRATALRALHLVVDAYLQLRLTLGGGAAASSASRQIQHDGEQAAQQLRELDGQIQAFRSEHQVIDLAQDGATATARLDDILSRENQVRERQQAVTAELAAADGQLQAAPARVFDAQETTFPAGCMTGCKRANRSRVRLFW